MNKKRLAAVILSVLILAASLALVGFSNSGKAAEPETTSTTTDGNCCDGCCGL